MESGTLYLVPTPIGNLADITYRAVAVLKQVDKILAEDTRTSGFLMKHYDIKTPLESFHQHNEHGKLQLIIDRLKSGQHLALISDAGTPGISDPGFLLARACIQEGIYVEALPGATAFIPALQKSGFALHRFVFEGFVPQKKGKLTWLTRIAAEPRTVVMYESPHRLLKTLEMLTQLCGPSRSVSVSREITKKFEQTLCLPLGEMLAYFNNQPPKGEFVIVLEGTDAALNLPDDGPND